MNRYGINVRELALQPREKQREFINQEVSLLYGGVFGVGVCGQVGFCPLAFVHVN